MPVSLTYRTADITRWGGGLGSNLSASQIDLNFWTLFSAVQALEDHQSVGAGIDYINQPAGGNLFYIHLTDHRVLGPFVIPTAQWTPRGAWQPTTNYAAYDLVSENGSLYLITIPHTSGATFSALSTDGLGHYLYNLLLQQPANELPTGGTVGQRLMKASSSLYDTAWATDFVRLALYVEGKPLAGEVLLQYAVVDDMTFPVGLAGSVVYAGTPTALPCSYTINKNGSPIGSIDFHGPSPETVSVAFSAAISCVPGDLITIVAPSVPDANQANLSFTIVANLT
jgi:hypothetical protein